MSLPPFYFLYFSFTLSPFLLFFFFFFFFCSFFLPFNFFTLKTRDCLRVVYSFHILNHWMKFAFVARVLLFSIPYEKSYMHWLSLLHLYFQWLRLLHCTALVCWCLYICAFSFRSRSLSTFCLALAFFSFFLSSFRLIRFYIPSPLLCIRFVVSFLLLLLLLFIHTNQFRISFTLLHVSFILFALFSKQWNKTK